MLVHIDASLPVHPLSVTDVGEMVRAGIIDAEDRIELLDGVLVEMSPQGESPAYAIRRLMALAFPVTETAGLELSIQSPLDVGSAISLPEPDMAIVAVTGRYRHPSHALLVVEMGATSVPLDLGRKAAIYATAGVPDYWVLDIERRVLAVHREPVDGRYTRVSTLGERETITAATVELVVPVSALL